jgi:hypothetical protein
MLLIFSSIIQLPNQFHSLSRKSQHVISLIFNNILNFSDLLTTSVKTSSTSQYTSLFNIIAEISIIAVSIIEEYQEILEICSVENKNNLNNCIKFSKITPYYLLTNSNSGVKYNNRLNNGICIISSDPFYIFNNIFRRNKIKRQINFHIHIAKLKSSNKKMSIGLHLNKSSELQVDDMKLWIYNQNDVFFENDVLSFFGMVNDNGVIENDYLICRNGVPIKINNNKWSTTLREFSNFNTQYKISEDKDDYKSIRAIISLSNIDDEVHFIKDPFTNLNCDNNGVDLPNKDFNILEYIKNIESKLPEKIQPLASTMLTMKSISLPAVNSDKLDDLSSFTPLMKNEFLNLCQSMRCILVDYNDYLNKPNIIETPGAIGWTINVSTSKLGEIIVKDLDKNDEDNTLHIDGKEKHISNSTKKFFDQDYNKIDIISKDKIDIMRKYTESKIGYDFVKLYNDNEVDVDINFQIGQIVTILNVDIYSAKILQLGHGGWSGKVMKNLLGKQGIIESFNDNGDVCVNISNIKRLWNPLMIDTYSPKKISNSEIGICGASHIGHRCIFPHGCTETGGHRTTNHSVELGPSWSCCDIWCSNDSSQCTKTKAPTEDKHSNNKNLYFFINAYVRIRRVTIPELIAVQNHFCLDNLTHGEKFVDDLTQGTTSSKLTEQNSEKPDTSPLVTTPGGFGAINQSCPRDCVTALDGLGVQPLGFFATLSIPKCSNGHSLEIKSMGYENRFSSWKCDICIKSFADNLERWCCTCCEYDGCFSCFPLPAKIQPANTTNLIEKFERSRLMLSIMGQVGKIKSLEEKDGVCLVEFSFGLICRIPNTMLIFVPEGVHTNNLKTIEG